MTKPSPASSLDGLTTTKKALLHLKRCLQDNLSQQKQQRKKNSLKLTSCESNKTLKWISSRKKERNDKKKREKNAADDEDNGYSDDDGGDNVGHPTMYLFTLIVIHYITFILFRIFHNGRTYPITSKCSHYLLWSYRISTSCW